MEAWKRLADTTSQDLAQTQRHGTGSVIKTQPTQVAITVSYRGLIFSYSID